MQTNLGRTSQFELAAAAVQTTNAAARPVRVIFLFLKGSYFMVLLQSAREVLNGP